MCAPGRYHPPGRYRRRSKTTVAAGSLLIGFSGEGRKGIQLFYMPAFRRSFVKSRIIGAGTETWDILEPLKLLFGRNP
jgi:hypothetical protein